MNDSAEDGFVLDELKKVSDQYVEYERLLLLADMASRTFVSNAPQIDTARNPIGLVVKTHT